MHNWLYNLVGIYISNFICQFYTMWKTSMFHIPHFTSDVPWDCVYGFSVVGRTDYLPASLCKHIVTSGIIITGSKTDWCKLCLFCLEAMEAWTVQVTTESFLFSNLSREKNVNYLHKWRNFLKVLECIIHTNYCQRTHNWPLHFVKKFSWDERTWCFVTQLWVPISPIQ